jgi:phosphoribosyl 1,2-cyclic phosphate phosphodiesterase
MDDLRQFCTNKGGAAIPVYSTEVGLERIKAIFPYAVGKPAASGYVSLGLSLMPSKLVLPGGGIIRSTLLPHGNESTLGLVFEEPSTGAKFAYYTDCRAMTEKSLELGEHSDLAILDGLRPNPHPTHMTVDQACQAAHDLRAKRALLTHMTYQIDYDTYTAQLRETHPKVGLCYDGLRIRLGA